MLKNVKAPTFEVLCSWCGALIRKSKIKLPEQMCLICHARMLNDYFQRLNKDKSGNGFTHIQPE
jgi:hypothetical protein